MRSSIGKFCALGGSLLISGCTSDKEAVECSAAFGIASAAAPQGEMLRLKGIAEADAARQARSAGKSATELRSEIQTSEMELRAKLKRGHATIFDSQTFKDCEVLYQ